MEIKEIVTLLEKEIENHTYAHIPALRAQQIVDYIKQQESLKCVDCPEFKNVGQKDRNCGTCEHVKEEDRFCRHHGNHFFVLFPNYINLNEIGCNQHSRKEK
jgi:hypothetical protein